jgi:hypothetical protein
MQCERPVSCDPTLEPDVAAVFQSSEAVNTFLRSAIAAMPSKRRAS